MVQILIGTVSVKGPNFNGQSRFKGPNFNGHSYF